MTKQQIHDERAAITALVKPNEGETLVEAVTRAITAASQGAAEAAGATCDPVPAGSTPAPATKPALYRPDGTINPAAIEDGDPNDPRPAFDAELGWRTPQVIAWAERRATTLKA